MNMEEYEGEFTKFAMFALMDLDTWIRNNHKFTLLPPRKEEHKEATAHAAAVEEKIVAETPPAVVGVIDEDVAKTVEAIQEAIVSSSSAEAKQDAVTETKEDTWPPMVSFAHCLNHTTLDNRTEGFKVIRKYEPEAVILCKNDLSISSHQHLQPKYSNHLVGDRDKQQKKGTNNRRWGGGFGCQTDDGRWGRAANRDGEEHQSIRTVVRVMGTALRSFVVCKSVKDGGGLVVASWFCSNSYT